MAREEFARHDIATKQGLSLTTDERIQLGLENPDAPHALKLRIADKVTNSRIRYAMSQLLNENLDNMNKWIREVAAQSPKAALELMIELAQFTTPKLKAIAVQVDDRSANPQNMSISELEKLVSEQ
jgi:hypothetical protein